MNFFFQHLFLNHTEIRHWLKNWSADNIQQILNYELAPQIIIPLHQRYTECGITGPSCRKLKTECRLHAQISPALLNCIIYHYGGDLEQCTANTRKASSFCSLPKNHLSNAKCQMSAADYVGNSGLHSGKENEAKEKKSLNFIGSRRRKAIERHSGLKKLTGNSVKWPKPLFKTSEQLHQLHSIELSAMFRN